MQKNWSKLCSLLKSCKTKLSYQGLRLAQLGVNVDDEHGLCYG